MPTVDPRRSLSEIFRVAFSRKGMRPVIPIAMIKVSHSVIAALGRILVKFLAKILEIYKIPIFMPVLAGNDYYSSLNNFRR